MPLLHATASPRELHLKLPIPLLVLPPLSLPALASIAAALHWQAICMLAPASAAAALLQQSICLPAPASVAAALLRQTRLLAGTCLLPAGSCQRLV